MNIRRKQSELIAILALVSVVIGVPDAVAAERYGLVTFAGVPVPGATVSVSQGETKLVTSTDPQGVYRFPDLAQGSWTIRVEMTAFATVVREIAVATDAMLPAIDLTLRPFAEVAREAVSPATAPGTTISSAPGAPSTSTATPPPASDTPAAPAPPPADPFGTADGLLINGSVLNGAVTPFAQSFAFGNNRRGQRWLYNGGVGAIFGNSALDARPYSFAGRPSEKPDYTDLQFLGTFGGPIRFPGIRTRSNLFLGYQRITDTNATTQSALVPTLLERAGDFSQSRDALGNSVRPIEPATGLPFDDGRLTGLSPQALALLGLYPEPNVDGANGYNYQTPIVAATHTDNVQARLTHSVNARNQLAVNAAFQRTAIDGNNLFGFSNRTVTSGFEAGANWSRRLSQFASLRLRYQFSTLGTNVTPHFADRTNVSALAGITGNDQDPANWGPPALVFSTGIAGLTDAQYARNRNFTNTLGGEATWLRGRHNFTYGGELRWHANNIVSQQDPRGTFGFNGAATGSDLADFLLGLPSSSSIAFGNADKFLRSRSYAAYISDDWRVSPSLTINAGLRWEYDSPIVEKLDRLSNLDVAPGFSQAVSVTAADPIGALTGLDYSRALMQPDLAGIQPRLGLAWRPLAASSLVVRAGYGIYRNAGIYQSIALLLAQQPPFSKAFSVANSGETPLTLANGFPSAGPASNTFAVDPNLRVGFAQNWQVSAQRDLPGSLTVLATYFGTYGNRLLQEIAPNTYPRGAVNPCETCPAGFIYLTSNGHSTRHAGQVQVRRRLQNGLTATLQYTLATARDDAGAFAGVSLAGSAIAQDWLDPGAEWGPSNFDQRHQVTAQVQYTTGMGLAGGALLDGWKGTLYKGWTLTSQLTTGSGLPVTPTYLTSIDRTGVTGTIRADALHVSTTPPDGYYLDPTAYAPPAPGRWGTAGRNSARGPSQFSLNAGVSRSFTLNDRLTLDWRIDATNVLNHVTFSSINALVGSPQFGLANRANSMRKIQSTMRLRF